MILMHPTLRTIAAGNGEPSKDFRQGTNWIKSEVGNWLPLTSQAQYRTPG